MNQTFFSINKAIFKEDTNKDKKEEFEKFQIS